jgi:hypothetical protein
MASRSGLTMIIRNPAVNYLQASKILLKLSDRRARDAGAREAGPLSNLQSSLGGWPVGDRSAFTAPRQVSGRHTPSRQPEGGRSPGAMAGVVYRKMAGHWIFRVDDGMRRAASAALSNYRNRQRRPRRRRAG